MDDVATVHYPRVHSCQPETHNVHCCCGQSDATIMSKRCNLIPYWPQTLVAIVLVSTGFKKMNSNINYSVANGNAAASFTILFSDYYLWLLLGLKFSDSGTWQYWLFEWLLSKFLIWTWHFPLVHLPLVSAICTATESKSSPHQSWRPKAESDRLAWPTTNHVRPQRP